MPGPAATDVPTASPAPAAETRAAGAFDCTPGYVYTAAEDGTIKQVSSTNAVTTPVTAPGSGAGDSRTWTSDTRKWGTGLLTKTWGMGPFGIGAGGTKAYSLERGNAATADTNYGIPSLQGLNVTRSFNYDQEVLLANKWSAQWFATRDTKGNRPLAAGAVVPTGKDAGQLYFGSFEASGTVGGAMPFRLSSYKPGGLNGAWRTIGTIPLPDFASDATTGNPESDYFAGSRGLEGDIAFDAAGNMYILASTQPKVNPNMPGGRSIKVQLITVPANSLMPIANRAVEIPVPAGASGTGLTGMATSADGTLFVSDATSVYRYDPVSWQLLGTVATSVGGSAPGSRLSDLASCSLPPTLTVTENLPQGRNLPTDQFSVAVHKGDATATSLTTSGTATGVQPQTAGPLMVLSTQAVTLTQTMPSGDPIGYLTTCSAPARRATPAAARGRSPPCTCWRARPRPASSPTCPTSASSPRPRTSRSRTTGHPPIPPPGHSGPSAGKPSWPIRTPPGPTSPPGRPVPWVPRPTCSTRRPSPDMSSRALPARPWAERPRRFAASRSIRPVRSWARPTSGPWLPASRSPASCTTACSPARSPGPRPASPLTCSPAPGGS
ncbi:Surface-anchored fimbrial subunit [Propionibacterium freudenreichii]|nr:Surface-anchored fimbrial subunit [Propionibacterium freudenreichii]